MIDEFVHGLNVVASGGRHSHSKPIKHFGGRSVWELMANDGGGTYRAVYTVHFKEAIYVLHVFQKKSKKGISTPKQDMELIEARLKAAKSHYNEWRK